LPEVLYTTAQEAADFGAPQDTVRVVQFSAAVGRSFAAGGGGEFGVSAL
jgi:hypothetical protein